MAKSIPEFEINIPEFEIYEELPEGVSETPEPSVADPNITGSVGDIGTIGGPVEGPEPEPVPEFNLKTFKEDIDLQDDLINKNQRRIQEPGRLGKILQSGALTPIESFAKFAEFASGGAYGSSEVVEELQKWQQKHAVPDITIPEQILKGTVGIPFYWGPAIGIRGAAIALKLAPKIAQILGIGTGVVTNAMVTSGEVYSNAVRNGFTDDETANKMASDAFLTELGVSGLTLGFGALAPGRATATRLAKDIALETGQELIQEDVQTRAARGDGLTGREALRTLAVAGPVSAIGAGAARITSPEGVDIETDADQEVGSDIGTIEPDDVVSVQNVPKEVLTSGVSEKTQKTTVPSDDGIESIGDFDMRVKMDGSGKPLGTQDIIKQIKEEIGVPVRAGRFKANKNVKGIYKKIIPDYLGGVVRTREYGDLAAASHEVAHFMDDIERFSSIAPPEVKAELKNLDYDQSSDGRRESEGFAEFIRHYTTTDKHQELAPATTRWFESAIEQSKFSESFRKMDSLIKQWRDIGSVNRAIGQIVKEPGLIESAKEIIANKSDIGEAIIKESLDRLQPLWRIQKEISGTKDIDKIPASDAFAPLAKVVNMRAPSVAKNMMLKAMVDNDGNPVGLSLKESIAPVAKQLQDNRTYDEFQAYLLARRELELAVLSESRPEGKKIKPKINTKDAVNIVNKFKNRPGWEKAARQITEWTRGPLLNLMTAGGISPEAVKAMITQHKNYVPYVTEFDEKGRAPGGSGRSFVNLPQGVSRITGSTRPVQDFFLSLVQHAERLQSLADKIRVTNVLVSAAESVGGMGRIIEEVPPDTVSKSTEIKNIKSQLENADVDLSNADMDAMISIFENIYRPDSKDMVVTLYRNGKKRMYQIGDKGLYEALVSIGENNKMHPFLDFIFGKSARLVRLMTTGVNAGFALFGNPPRDLPISVMQSGGKGLKINPLSKLIDNTKNTITSLRNPSEAAKLFRGGGGEMSQILGADRKHAREAINGLLEVGTRDKLRRWATHPIQTARELFSAPEMGPRIAEFETAIRELGWRPGDRLTFEQFVKGQFRAANVTTDFREGGDLAMKINRAVPFFNATIQGPNRMVYAMKKNPVGVSAKAFAYLTLPAIGLWLKNKDEQWYKDLPSYEKWMYLHLKMNDTIIRIPVPFEWGLIFQSIPVSLMDAVYNSNPQEIKDAITEAVKGFIPDFMPAAIGPAIEVAADYDFFRGKRITSKSDESLKPEDQYSIYTSELSKYLGRKLDVSPKKVDHLIRGYGSELALDIVRGMDGFFTTNNDEVPKTKSDYAVIGRLFLRENLTRVINDFYEGYDKLQRNAGSSKLAVESANARPKSSQAVFGTVNSIARILSISRKKQMAIIRNPKLSMSEKKRRLNREINKYIEIGRRGIVIINRWKKLNEIEETNPKEPITQEQIPEFDLEL